MTAEEKIAFLQGYVGALIQVMENDEDRASTVFWLKEIFSIISEGDNQ